MDSTAKLMEVSKILPIRDFQFKKYPKIPCSAGILPANNTRMGKIPLDSEALLQAVHFFCGVL
jgi:hypothetical protein